MKIDIVYIGNELVISLTGTYQSQDLLEIERRVDLIINDYDISNIRFNIDDVNNVDRKQLNNLIMKYHSKLKEA